jgi:TetR/AcrR family transcriptional regulator, transcriptional repressor for nem operon
LTLETIVSYMAPMNDTRPSPRRPAMGRPRSFDMEAVVARAVPVFREHGYEGASIDRLKTATGLTAGSLYKAFKDKRGVFAAAFAQYVTTRQRALAACLRGSSGGREKIAETLRFYLASSSGPDGRQGCLVLASLIEVTTLDDALQQVLRETLAVNRAALLALLREGQLDGSIRADLAIEQCADVLLSLLQGFRAMGKLHDPADHEALIAIALKTLD